MSHEKADTISDVLLESEQFLALHIGESLSNQTVSNDTIRTKDSEIWFFQVADVSELVERSIRLYDETGTARGPLSSGSGLEYSQLFDTNGDDTLRNDEEDWRVYHFSVGTRQDDLRVYPRVPENQNGGGFAYLTGSEPDPTEADPFGYVPGHKTDYDDPATSLESIAWRNGQRSVHQYGFYNDDDVQVDPLLSVQGAAYQLRPVTDRESMLNLLADMGRPVGQQQNRIRTVDFSRSALRTFSYSVPEEWKDAQNTLTIKSANLPEEIEESLQLKEEVQNGGDN